MTIRMRSLRLTVLLLGALTGLLVLGANARPAAAQANETFSVAMKELSRSTERVLHEFLRPDPDRLHQASEELRESASLSLSAAQAMGFGESELQDFLYILEDARQVESFLAVGERGEALAVYYEMVDRCIACHEGTSDGDQ